MATVYSTRTYDWQDLADESVTEDYLVTDYVASSYFTNSLPLGWEEWTEWTGNGVNIDGSTGYDDLVYFSNSHDFGETKTFYFTATAISHGTHTIALQTSSDNGVSDPWADQSLGAVTARYARFKVTVVNATETANLSYFRGEFYFDAFTESFNSFSVGATNTTLPITRNYSLVASMTYSAPQSKQVVLSDKTASAPKVIGYDLDTWGKVAAAFTADITLQGYPELVADANGNITFN